MNRRFKPFTCKMCKDTRKMWLESRYVRCPHCPSYGDSKGDKTVAKDSLDDLREAVDLHGRLIQAYNLLPWSLAPLKEQLQEEINNQGAKVKAMQNDLRERLKRE